jgi:DNA polymerase I-like protein with 3'-5' exonuclease and polymerase domains
MKTITFDIDHGLKVKSFNPELPVVDVGTEKRILFVLDKLDYIEQKQNSLLVGPQGSLITSLVTKAKSTYVKNPEDKKFSWSCINYINSIIGENRTECYEYFNARVEAYCKKFKPTAIICFSPRFLRNLLPEKFGNYQNYGKYLGAFVEWKKIKIFPCIEIYNLVTKTPDEGLAGALEIVCNIIANGIANKIQFGINEDRILESKKVIIESVKQFKSMMKELRTQEIVAIDTETTNLNKIQNKLLTIQFAYSEDLAYILPIYHQDSTFSLKERQYIFDELKTFFEGENSIKYFIFHNANFDLNVIRVNLKIDFYPNNVWDTIGGEFGHSENWKFIGSCKGLEFKPYALETVAIRYGFFAYGHHTIAKNESKNIQTKKLSDPLVTSYCAFDVLVPFAIQKKQMARAKFLGYTKYESLVSHQISDQINSFSDMNMNGLHVDINYLMYLNSNDSPILKVLREMEQSIYATEEAKIVNKKLIKSENVPTSGLFGKVTTWLFDIHKRDHKARLFFDELGLKPLSYGKDKKGKVDKVFKAHYSDIPAVKAYSDLGKAEKLRDSYVKSFLKKLAKSDDFKHDFCIRPSFNFRDIVTGRISENDPNCQQIPSHSELGKHIKRLFTAPEGWVVIKVDYSAHEVRGLALISKDSVLAQVFQVGLDLRNKFRLKPSKETALEIELTGDVHKLNVAFFFSKDLTKIAKDVLKQLRNQIKAVVFGLIYGKGNKALSRDLDKPEDFVEAIVKKFFNRFKRGGQWLIDIEKFSRANLFVESPLGRRRNLSAYLIPKSFDVANKLWAAMDRRARNSPIQGMCSDFGFIGVRRIVRNAWNRAKKVGQVVLKVCNVVHDSTETICRYEHIMYGIKTIYHELTDGVAQTVEERHGFKFCIGLEIDLEVGANLRDCQVWNGDAEELFRIIAETFVFQRDVLGYEIKVKKLLKHCLVEQFNDMPKLLQQQINNRKSEIDLDAIYSKAVVTVKESSYK